MRSHLLNKCVNKLSNNKRFKTPINQAIKTRLYMDIIEVYQYHKSRIIRQANAKGLIYSALLIILRHTLNFG